jgi:phosphatidylserine/phosphatidylglycerophosphate/cardiolipin synthase-like enzyme
MGCRTTPRRYWRRLSEAGCAVRPAQPVTPAHLLRLLRRNHRKLCSVDGERAILGGVCIADEWAGDPARGREAWRDAALDVRGPAVGSLETTFGRLWREAVTAFEPRPAGQAELRVIEGIPGGFRLHRAVEFLAATAGHQIWITDAYFVPPPTLMRALTSAARDGVDVRLLLPGQTDLPVVRALTRVGYRDLLRTGVRIWEWHGAMLHSKTALVDGRHFKIGSSNLNPSSLGGNWELDVLVDDPALGAEACPQGSPGACRARSWPRTDPREGASRPASCPAGRSAPCGRSLAARGARSSEPRRSGWPGRACCSWPSRASSPTAWPPWRSRSRSSPRAG